MIDPNAYYVDPASGQYIMNAQTGQPYTHGELQALQQQHALKQQAEVQPTVRPSQPVDNSFEQRLSNLESWMETVKKLISRQREMIDAIEAKIGSQVTPPPAKVETDEAKPNKRSVLTYTSYVKIMALVNAGKADKDISKELGIPYTTVRKYKAWSADEVETAKRKEMTGMVGTKQDVSVEWSQDGQVHAPTTSEAGDWESFGPAPDPLIAGAGSISEAVQNAGGDQPSQVVTTVGDDVEVEVRRPQPFPPKSLAGTESPIQTYNQPVVPDSRGTVAAVPRIIGHNVSYLTNPPTMVPVYEGQAYNPQSFIPYIEPPSGVVKVN